MSGTQPASGDPGTPSDRTTTTTGKDPLRGSRTSGLWVAVVLSGVVLVLLITFIAQNTDPVDVEFLGWKGETPLAVALLIATVAGLFLAAVAGSVGIRQPCR